MSATTRYQCASSFDRGDEGDDNNRCLNYALQKGETLPDGKIASGILCEFCQSRSNIMKDIKDALSLKKHGTCKSGMYTGSDQVCNREALYNGYCLHCLTYYDSSLTYWTGRW